jgi:glutaredoxin 3
MIIIYGKPMCPFCEKAKQFCETRGFNYEYKSMGTDFTREELLETFPEARTVPQIIINGEKIGGYDKLTSYVENTNYTGTGHTL